MCVYSVQLCMCVYVCDFIQNIQMSTNVQRIRITAVMVNAETRSETTLVCVIPATLDDTVRMVKI